MLLFLKPALSIPYSIFKIILIDILPENIYMKIWGICDFVNASDSEWQSKETHDVIVEIIHVFSHSLNFGPA